MQSTKSNDIEPLPTRLVLFLFFISGALALVYQVVWSRVMTHVFGCVQVLLGILAASALPLLFSISSATPIRGSRRVSTWSRHNGTVSTRPCGPSSFT